MNAEIDIKLLEGKIDELNQQAWQIRVDDSNKALALSKEAIALSEKINYIKGKAQGIRTLGFSYIRLSRNQEALEYLTESFELFKSLDDLHGQAVIYGYYGIVYRSLGDYSASLNFHFKSLEITKQIDEKEGESLCYYHLGVTYKYLGNYEQALEYLLQCLAVARAIHFWTSESYALNLIGQIYFETKDFVHALNYFHQSLAIRREAGDKWGEAGCLDNIGTIHFNLGDYNEAIQSFSDSLSISESVGDKKGLANALFHLGTIYNSQGNYISGIDFAEKSLRIRQEASDKKGEAEALVLLAELYGNNPDENSNYPLELLEKAHQLGQETKALDLLSKIQYGFYKVYKRINNYEAALIHFEKFTDLDQELHKDALNKRILNLEISYRVEQAQKETEIFRMRNIELANLYEESNRQKDEIEVQKRNIEETLNHLKTTQHQLIQREKMASLGELTAGIAHEIQNPLNFVNNFSSVSMELLEELQQDLTLGKVAEAMSISKDIMQNLAKITQHGQRADSIVKGMLQHSHYNTGQKKLTDINILIDEYLRLAFHGFRAKYKDYSADLMTHFEEGLSKVEVMPQEFGRVLINLFNNAFYATQQKKIQIDKQYQPIIQVTTSQQQSQIEIKIRDNGSGIPDKVKSKIFQPFFTTKPPGQGTGLGLSLSYDIIKAHGGEVAVQTIEGEQTEFIVKLPAQT